MDKKELRVGLKRGTVQLFAYSEEWKGGFEAEKKLLQKVFGQRLKRIEHIGSTAIFGIAAKPIIDMMAVVDSIEMHCMEVLMADFEALDYIRRLEEGVGIEVWGQSKGIYGW
ncbi:MAG: GrpB family protein [Chitinophagales bacterium]